MGEPEFGKHDYGLVYVSQYDGRFVQQKYIYQAVYPTADGRWAGCGDPYKRIPEIHRHDLKAEPVTFRPPVVFDVRGLSLAEVAQKYPSPIFRRKQNSVVCEMGNYPEDLFRVMADGYLKARGVFNPAPR